MHVKIFKKGSCPLSARLAWRDNSPIWNGRATLRAARRHGCLRDSQQSLSFAVPFHSSPLGGTVMKPCSRYSTLAARRVPPAVLAVWPAPLAAQDDAAGAELRAGDEQLVKRFNAGKAAELAAIFLPKGELIDEEGTVTQGTKELTELF